MHLKDMAEYLKNHSVPALSTQLNIPLKSLCKYLQKNGFDLDVIQPEKIKRDRINKLDIYGDEQPYYDGQKLSDTQLQIIRGSLFGDSGIYWSTENYTAYLKCEHCWAQIGYVKAIIELLKPFSFSPYIDPPSIKIPGQDYQVGFSCHASEELAGLRNLYYTQKIEDSIHLQKDVMQVRLWDYLTPMAVAFWVMDDGKKNGSGFSIPIGKQLYYNRDRLEECVYSINKRMCIDFKVFEEKNCYSIAVRKGSYIIELIKDFIFPEFYYKIGLKPNDCGIYYKEFDWYKKWQIDRMSLIHPLIEKTPYSKPLFLKLGVNEKEKYIRAVFCQVTARGFPYVTISNEERKSLFAGLKSSQAKISEDSIISSSGSFNAIANSFMNHRYELKVKNNKSPYEIFIDKHLLKEVLNLQLKSGPNINNGNIRAALSVYKGQGVGQFNTLYAKTLLDKYCVSNGNVLDPCAGFGSRLIGCVASGRNYYGIEPAPMTYKSLVQIKEWLTNINSNNSVTLFEECAENHLYPANFFDIALTSPPYFNKEEYAYDEKQSFIRYPTLNMWLEGFLGPFIQKVYSSLKSGAVFILNIDDIDTFKIVDKALDFSKICGFVHEATYFSAALKRPGAKLSTEPFLILRKN